MTEKHEQIDKVYGPHTLQLGKFGWLTQLWLRFFVWTTYIHETPRGIVVYKQVGRTMYVLGAVQKLNQVDQPGLS